LPGAKANGYFDWYGSACWADAWVQVPQAGADETSGSPTIPIRTSPVRRRSVTSRFESSRPPRARRPVGGHTERRPDLGEHNSRLRVPGAKTTDTSAVNGVVAGSSPAGSRWLP